MARNRICVAVAMAEARSPGLPRYRTFRPKPELARRREQHGEPLAAARPQASALQLPAAVEVSFLVIRRPLPREALASLPALVFPLPSAPLWRCLFFPAEFCFGFRDRTWRFFCSWGRLWFLFRLFAC